MKTINISWCTEDVMSLDSTLSEQEADLVLENLEKNHNAELGINWEVIENTISFLENNKQIKQRKEV